MSWVALSLLSALLLGLYDLAKKHALRENAVLPVLFFGVLASAAVWLPLVLMSSLGLSMPDVLRVEEMNPVNFLQLFAKSSLVGTAWIFGYFALKHLPLSIAGPVRATSPLWTILIAVSFMHERPGFWQWIGLSIVLIAFYAFSFVGKLEGIHFRKDKWIGFMIAATLLGALSAVYDKYLLQNIGLRPATVQAWFTIFLVVYLAPFYFLWRQGKWPRSDFQWRWSILFIGLLLLLADFLYFTAVQQEGALISVISPIRRCAVFITFLGGIFLMKEKNFWPKLLCICGMLLGILLLNLKTA
ncbi:MAG: DMT family transporter [Verrucomicrobiota bacterium]